MGNDELTQYIAHYVEKDKTKSAIMLTGDWGSGKSHYITNELIPRLESKFSTQCIIISLYGMDNISEISKQIFWDLKLKSLNKKIDSPIVKVIGKTFFNSIANKFNVDLDNIDSNLQKIYESIDLSDKLIILEDVERSKIDILDILGYVNSLVDQDGAKFLLVANEKEFIKFNVAESNTHNALYKQHNNNNIDNQEYTQHTKAYLNIKEKTISDTLQFKGNLNLAIRQIIDSFNHPKLNNFVDDNYIEKIRLILINSKTPNLRTFIFSCQKTVDILDKILDQYDDSFIQCIFFGIITFALKLKSGKNVDWDSSENYSINLASEEAPLFKFCYEYIMWQKFDISKVSLAYKAFNKKKTYDKNKSRFDSDLNIIFNYFENVESDVLKAVDSISERLNNPEDISFYDYGSIVSCLVNLKEILGCNIDSTMNKLVKNLEGRGKELNIESLFRMSVGEMSASAKFEYNKWREKMKFSLNNGLLDIPNFDYLPEQSMDFYSYVCQSEHIFRNHNSFAGALDINRLAEMFINCTPKEKHAIRGVFLAIYRSVNLQHYNTNDYQSIKLLLELIKADAPLQTDKIQILQYKWFVDNLTDILERMQ